MSERPISLTASVAIHALLLLLGFFTWRMPVEEPLSEPVELVDLPWTAPGAGESDRPAPGKPRPQSQAVPKPEAPAPRQKVEAPKPAPVTQAPAVKAPAKAKAEVKPDLDALLAERLKETQDKEAKRLGELASSDLSSVVGTGKAPESGGPLQEGSVNMGTGMKGDLGKRGILTKVEPDYPPAALRNSQMGDVTLRVWVDPRGNVSRVEVVRLSGTTAIDNAALAAMKKWKFAPLPDDVAPVTQYGDITLKFQLR